MQIDIKDVIYTVAILILGILELRAKNLTADAAMVKSMADTMPAKAAADKNLSEAWLALIEPLKARVSELEKENKELRKEMGEVQAALKLMTATNEALRRDVQQAVASDRIHILQLEEAKIKPYETHEPGAKL